MLRTLPNIALLAAALAIAPAAHAADETNVSAGLTAAGAPLALHGVDPVAFSDLGNRIDGAASFTAVHDGAAYYFVSAENRDAFRAEPTAYLPQNGGFCTYGVSKGKKFDGDPRYADVVGGKLYLFLNEQVFRAYQKDRAGTIARAAEKWPRIRNVAATDL